LIVDCHCHVIPAEMTTTAVPPRWRPRLGRTEEGRRSVTLAGRVIRSIIGEFTDVDTMLGEASAQGIHHLLLSPWIMLVPTDADAAECREVCLVQNAALSALAATRPAQVTVLGAVPLADPVRAAECLREAMRLPGVRGAEIPASVRGSYLGEQKFEPFWAAAEESGALIFVHPTTTGFGLEALRARYLWNSVGNPLETAVTAAHLITAGVLERHPGLRILLAHGGGGLHALRGRLRRAYAVRPEASADSDQGPDASLRWLYYDALTHDWALLADLIAFVGAHQVVLGSDRPFDMGSEHPVDEIRALGLPSEEENMVLGGNAQRLLGIATRSAGDDP